MNWQWWLIIAGLGGFGGALNSLWQAGGHFYPPRRHVAEDGRRGFDPGMIRDVLYGVGAALGAYGSLDLAKLGSGEQIGSAIAFGFGGVTFLDQWAQQKKVANKEESVQSLAAAYKDLADRLPKPSPPGDHGS